MNLSKIGAIWKLCKGYLELMLATKADAIYWEKECRAMGPKMDRLRERAEAFERRNLELLDKLQGAETDVIAFKTLLADDYVSGRTYRQTSIKDMRVAFVPMFKDYPFAETYDDAKVKAAQSGFETEAIVCVKYFAGQFDSPVKNTAEPS